MHPTHTLTLIKKKSLGINNVMPFHMLIHLLTHTHTHTLADLDCHQQNS